MKKNTLTFFILAFANAVLSLVYLLSLPQTVPIHYNAAFECDAVGSKWTYAVVSLFPFISCLIVPLTMKFAKNAKRNEKVITLSAAIIGGLFLTINWWTLLCIAGSSTAIGDKLSGVNLWFFAILMTILFMALGNYMPLVKQNGMLGLRVKWTLENEACWNASHRFLGRFAVYGGMVFLAIDVALMIAGVDSIIGMYLFLIFMMAVVFSSTAFAYIHRND